MTIGTYAADGSVRVVQTDGAGNDVGSGASGTAVVVATIDDMTNSSLGMTTVSRGMIFDGTTWDRWRSNVNITSSVGTGIAAVGITAQLDDASPQAITEGQWGNVRMDSARGLITAPFPVRKSYKFGTLSIAPTAAGTIIQMQGSGTRTIYIKRVRITGSLTTAARGHFRIIKNTTAETGGTTTTAPTILQLDTANPNTNTSTATLTAYTTAGTPGTSTGTAGVKSGLIGTPTTIGEEFVFEFGVGTQPLTLRGTGEYMVINSATFAAYTGASFSIECEWVEE